MKLRPATGSTRRHYDSSSRSEAAEAATQQILTVFVRRLESEWFDAITLDSLAKDCGTTVQTILRKFGNKSGLLEAAHRRLGNDINQRREVAAGDVTGAVDKLTHDYEQVGRLIMRLLDQEARHPELKPFMDVGRRGHREWLATVFKDPLSRASGAQRQAMLDALVSATDLYLWKLIRLDMARPAAAYKKIVHRFLLAALHPS
ncbi:TetR/AcrR family transcriptional regulator [Nibricoccus sp. IMCC34717]|uniref:TetR/AcrR family transcriptional regulator n=1 Tax=Nibricoccus sp. IMCC34717 TaxID=3034021 RepID=UPI00384FBC85